MRNSRWQGEEIHWKQAVNGNLHLEGQDPSLMAHLVSGVLAAAPQPPKKRLEDSFLRHYLTPQKRSRDADFGGFRNQMGGFPPNHSISCKACPWQALPASTLNIQSAFQCLMLTQTQLQVSGMDRHLRKTFIHEKMGQNNKGKKWLKETEKLNKVGTG
jgi:hypothetical protein